MLFDFAALHWHWLNAPPPLVLHIWVHLYKKPKTRLTAEPFTYLFRHTGCILIGRQTVTEVHVSPYRRKLSDLMILVQFLRDPLALLFYQLHILTFAIQAVFSVSRYSVCQDKKTHRTDQKNTHYPAYASHTSRRILINCFNDYNIVQLLYNHKPSQARPELASRTFSNSAQQVRLFFLAIWRVRALIHMRFALVRILESHFHKWIQMKDHWKPLDLVQPYVLVAPITAWSHEHLSTCKLHGQLRNSP